MPGLFSSNKTTNQNTSFNSNSSSQGTADFANNGQTSVTPTLDPSIAPLIPQIANADKPLLSSDDTNLVSTGLDKINRLALDPNINANLGEANTLQNQSALTPSAVTNSIGALEQNPNIAYNGSAVPNVNAKSVSTSDVTGSDVASRMNPYISTAVDAYTAQQNRLNDIDRAKMSAHLAANKSFGDQSANPMLELMNNQSLAEGNTIAGMENTGFNSAENWAQTDAARNLTGQQSNQGADLTAQTANQGAGLTKAAADLSAQVQGAQIGQAGQIAAAQLAAQQQGIQQQAGMNKGALTNQYVTNNLATGAADVSAPISALTAGANIAYGAPQGQSGSTSSTGTSAQSSTGQASGTQTGTSTTSSNPSIFQDIIGGAAMLGGMGFARGGLVRRAEGGALDTADPGVSDWMNGRVHSSDMGSPVDAPTDLPPPSSVNDLAIHSAAMALPPSPAERKAAASAPREFHGALDRFIDNMANSPAAQFGMGVLATPQSGLLPLSSGLQAVLAQRAALSKQAYEKAQTEAVTQQTAQQKEMFGYRKQAIDDELASPDASPFGGSPAAGRAAGPGSAAATQPVTTGATGPGAGNVVPSDSLPSSLQQQLAWMTRGYEKNRRYALMMGDKSAGTLADKFLGMIDKVLPAGMIFDPQSKTVRYAPGVLSGAQSMEYAKESGKAPWTERASLLNQAGRALPVGPDQVATTGAQLLGISPVGSGGGNPVPPPQFDPKLEGMNAPVGASGRPLPVKTSGPGSNQGGAYKPPGTPDAGSEDDLGTGLVRNPDGSLSNPFTPLTKPLLEHFATDREAAIDAAEHAQESDTQIARLKVAFDEMKTKGTYAGWATPALGEMVGMARSLGINTDDVAKTLGIPLPKIDTVSDVQVAEKASKIIMGKILKQMYPQRITNVDMMVNKGIAPGAGLTEAANLNLIDSIERQNAWDKKFATAILAVNPRNMNKAINFHNDFYKENGFGPLFGKYYSQSGGQTGPISSKRFSSGKVPEGLPPNAQDTGRTTEPGGKGDHVWEIPGENGKPPRRVAVPQQTGPM